MNKEQGPILYVLVVGFHHKKGCQVEYSFPPLVPGSPNECPPGWKYLPTLALPDGSHNYDDDTVYFHLPSLNKPRKTVYGISCYRQIPVDKIKNLTADITRGTVQKSVCVLSSLPLYGHIQVKMALITHAYFDEGDFSKVSILEDTYHHLNSVLLQNEQPLQTFVGLSARDFILHWRHKAILLFKLLLLEKRVIFYKSPVHPLCSSLLTLISLFPLMIEDGLEQAACLKLSRPMSPMPTFSDDDFSPDVSPKITKNNSPDNNCHESGINESVDIPLVCNSITNCKLDINNTEKQLQNVVKVDEQIENMECNCTEVGLELTESDNTNLRKEVNDANYVLNNGNEKNALKNDVIADTAVQNNMFNLAHVSIENCGFPLSIFTQGYLCLPYLSLPYLDLLNDVNVRGYIIGATNVLFKQKRQLSDILVDIDAGRIECQDLELRKQLHLTTEDLRFADYIVKHVSEERHDVFLDGVGWEGGDEWIRSQFKVYLLCLLRTSILQDGSREADHFNTYFMSAWKDTHNYKMWNTDDNKGILEVNPGHPFAGQLSVADMKLRFAHTMQNTEGGRKLNQAMVSTGRAVATTSKAVGGALSQAKGAFSNWFSNLLVSPDPVQKGIEPINDVVNGEEADNVDENNQKNVVNNINNGDLVENMKHEENSVIESTSNLKSSEKCEEEKYPMGKIHTV